MKNLKLSLFVFALLLGASATSFAQTADVEVSATMTATVNLSATDVLFGDIAVGDAASIDVSGVVTGGAGTGTIQAGTVTVAAADPSGTVSISWPASVSLENATGDAIDFTPAVDITAGATAVGIASGSSFVHTTATATVLTVYGTLDASTEAGAFSTVTSGDPLTFTASYL